MHGRMVIWLVGRWEEVHQLGIQLLVCWVSMVRSFLAGSAAARVPGRQRFPAGEGAVPCTDGQRPPTHAML